MVSTKWPYSGSDEIGGQVRSKGGAAAKRYISNKVEQSCRFCAVVHGFCCGAGASVA